MAGHLIIVWNLPAPSASIVEEILGKDLYYEEVSEDQDEITHRYSMKVVAHRGAGLDAPENSISALKLAKEKGCTAVEFDLALTADNMPIIFHDSSVERVTLRTGNIQEMMWADIKKLDIAAKHPFKERYKGERIPLFEEVIIECLKMDFRLFIDIKSDLQFSSFRVKGNKVVETILDAYNRYPELYKRAIVSSFDPLVIYLIRRANPGIVCSLAYRPHFFSYESYNGTVGASRPRYKNLFKHLAAQWLDVVHGWLLEHIHYYLLGLSAILLQKDIVNMHVVSHWRDRGLRVIPWTVNLPLEKQFFSRVLKLTYMTDTLLAVSDDLKPRVSRQSTRDIHESTTNEPNQLFKLQPKKESTTNEPHELDS